MRKISFETDTTLNRVFKMAATLKTAEAICNDKACRMATAFTEAHSLVGM